MTDNEVFCVVEDFDAVLRQEIAGTPIVGISRDDFMRIAVAAALGEHIEPREFEKAVKRLKTGIAVGKEQTDAEA